VCGALGDAVYPVLCSRRSKAGTGGRSRTKGI